MCYPTLEPLGSSIQALAFIYVFAHILPIFEGCHLQEALLDHCGTQSSLLPLNLKQADLTTHLTLHNMLFFVVWLVGVSVSSLDCEPTEVRGRPSELPCTTPALHQA